MSLQEVAHRRAERHQAEVGLLDDHVDLLLACILC